MDQIKGIHYGIFKQFQGVCCRNDLLNIGIHGRDIDSIIGKLKDNPRLFWVSQPSVSESVEIRTKVHIRLCGLYLNGKCTSSTCSALHLCKNYLISGKFCMDAQCKFGFSHDIHDAHNSKVWVEVSAECNIRMPTMKLVRSSFPRLCETFRKNGTCEKVFCGYMHYVRITFTTCAQGSVRRGRVVCRSGCSIITGPLNTTRRCWPYLV